MKVNLSYKDDWFGPIYLHVGIEEFKCLECYRVIFLKSPQKERINYQLSQTKTKYRLVTIITVINMRL